MACSALSLNATVFCRVAGEDIFVGTARREHHSFGGSFPQRLRDITAAYERPIEEIDGIPLALELGGEDPLYPPESYVHPANIENCELCGHRCMD